MLRLVNALTTAGGAVLYARLDTGWRWPIVPSNGDVRDITPTGSIFIMPFGRCCLPFDQIRGALVNSHLKWVRVSRSSGLMERTVPGVFQLIHRTRRAAYPQLISLTGWRQRDMKNAQVTPHADVLMYLNVLVSITVTD